MDTTEVDRNTWSPPLVGSGWSALCQTLYDGVDHQDWESMYNTLREAAKRVASRRSGSARAWCGSGARKKGWTRTCKVKVANSTQGRKGLVEVPRRREPRKFGGAERRSTYCSVEDQEGGPPYKQDDLMW